MLKIVRRLLSWKFTVICVPALLTIAVAAIGVIPSLASLGVSAKIPSVVGDLLIGLSCAWTLCHWHTSSALQKKNPATWAPNRRRGASKKQPRIYQYWKWGVSVAIVGLFGLSLGIAYYVEEQIELARPYGWLIPASDPMPRAPLCGPLPDNSLMLFLGSSAVIAQTFPHPLLTVNRQGVIVLYKNHDGEIALSVDILSTDGKIVARIERNEMTVNLNNVFRWKRPDRSTLWVEDQNGKRVLWARYLKNIT